MKKRLNRLWEWIKTRWKWYVLGYYHCDQCPYSWSEYSYEGDGDCGCYIKGELWDTCRLIEPIRSLLGWPKKRYVEYWESHQYDGYDVFYDEIIQRDLAFEESLEIFLKNKEVYGRDHEGKLIPICKKELQRTFPIAFDEALTHYEEKVHPFQARQKLSTRWKDLLLDTWKECIYNNVAPFMPRRKKK